MKNCLTTKKKSLVQQESGFPRGDKNNKRTLQLIDKISLGANSVKIILLLKTRLDSRVDRRPFPMQLHQKAKFTHSAEIS